MSLYAEYQSAWLIEKTEAERKLSETRSEAALLESASKLAIKDKELEKYEEEGVKTRGMLEEERKL